MTERTLILSDTNSGSLPDVAPPPRAAPGTIILTMVVAYSLLLSLAFALFRSSLATVAGSEMSVHRAMFFAVNAGTNTGFQTSVTVESLRPAARIASLLLMIAGALLSWIAGGWLVARAIALTVSFKQLAIYSAALLLLAVLAGGGLLVSGDRWSATFQGISAVCNGGVWIGDSPAISHQRTAMVLVPLAVLGGLGITVVIELTKLFRRQLSNHAITTLAAIAGVYLFGVLAVLTGQWFAAAVSGDNWRDVVSHASLLSLNSRSAGLPVELLGTLDRPTQWTTAILMLVGAGSGGAGGGLKVTSLVIAFAGVIALLRDRRPARAFAIALCWIAAHLTLIAITWWLLLGMVAEQTADRLLMLAISAAGNVGLSHDVVSATGNDALILSATMLAGRLLPLAFLYWLSRVPQEDQIALA
ncbi:MAG TPA: hypothetical protein PLD59_06645 [Tepidisphaeraceae bacterium]|nr:hypothetical protein [Tepidisphaeraceae bacterium]